MIIHEHSRSAYAQSISRADQVLDALRQHGPMCCDGIADILGVPVNLIAPSVCHLRHDGIIVAVADGETRYGRPCDVMAIVTEHIDMRVAKVLDLTAREYWRDYHAQ